MKNFEDLGLNQALNASLARMKYATPTPIQSQAIPLALDGHDIMGSAQTGTGKTAAFAIPLVERLLNTPEGSALVLTPTRELGKQIMDIMQQLLGPKSPIKTAFIIGGEPMGKQINKLRDGARLIVGTPGRINDHLRRGTMDLSETDFLVLDETDRMLDMGFTIQLEDIFKHMPKKRQTLMFSATLPKNIVKMSENYLSNPKRVSVGEVNVIATNIKQEVVRIEQDKKYEELISQLHERNGSVIVFIKTKHGADKMAKNLRRDGFTSEALHGDLRQNKRDRVMKNFRDMNFRILIATDIAARGLDVPHIEHVINYDLPQVAEDFIHRMGRTARAGATGSAISFVSNQDGRKWHAIACLIDPEAAANDRSNRGRGGKGGQGGRGRNDRNKNGGRGGQGKSQRPQRSEKQRRSKAPHGGKSFGNNKPRHQEDRGEHSSQDRAPSRNNENRDFDARDGNTAKKKSTHRKGPSVPNKGFGDKPAHKSKGAKGKPSSGKSAFNPNAPMPKKRVRKGTKKAA